MKSRKGRPTKYSDELAAEICNVIASTSKGTKKLCEENKHWPCKDTIFSWRRNYPEFSDQYARAKQLQVETLIDEILEIADDTSHDEIINNQGSAVCNKEYIARSRLRIDTRKWLASKLVPKVYGNINNDSIVNESLVEKLLDKL